MPRKSVKISEISRIYRFLPLSQLDHYYTRRQDNVINIMRPSKRSNLLNFAALIKSLDIHYIEEPIIRQLINVGIDKIWGKRGEIGVIVAVPNGHIIPRELVAFEDEIKTQRQAQIADRQFGFGQPKRACRVSG